MIGITIVSSIDRQTTVGLWKILGYTVLKNILINKETLEKMGLVWRSHENNYTCKFVTTLNCHGFPGVVVVWILKLSFTTGLYFKEFTWVYCRWLINSCKYKWQCVSLCIIIDSQGGFIQIYFHTGNLTQNNYLSNISLILRYQNHNIIGHNRNNHQQHAKLEATLANRELRSGEKSSKYYSRVLTNKIPTTPSAFLPCISPSDILTTH